MTRLWLPLLWLLNGVLWLAYTAFEHALPLLLVPALVILVQGERPQRRPWMLAAGALGLLASTFAPDPVPAATLLVAWAGVGAVAVERHDPLARRWQVAQGLALYGLAGLGFLAYKTLLPWQTSGDPATLQAQSYLNALLGIAMYIIPLGYLSMLVQSMWVHPATGDPKQMITTIRTRGKR